MSDYSRKYDAAQAEMAAAGIWPSNAEPPYIKALRARGFEVRPPHYQAWQMVLITQGPVFGVTWGFVMYVFLWMDQGLGIGVAILAGAAAGFLFAALMAAYYARGRQKLGLSDWDSL